MGRKGDHLGEFEQIVLLAVARGRVGTGTGGGGHGAWIHEEILRRTGRDVTIASVYVTLSRLETKGHVDSEVVRAPDDEGGRARKVFSVTDSGVLELRTVRLMQDRLWDGLDFKPARSEQLP